MSRRRAKKRKHYQITSSYLEKSTNSDNIDNDSYWNWANPKRKRNNSHSKSLTPEDVNEIAINIFGSTFYKYKKPSKKKADFSNE